jgi:chaperonin GroEL (HSP60 family)
MLIQLIGLWCVSSDALTELKAAHDKGKMTFGIDVNTGKTMDAFAAGVLEPLKIKTQAIASASEVAIMLLRIDDVISGKKDGQD